MVRRLSAAAVALAISLTAGCSFGAVIGRTTDTAVQSRPIIAESPEATEQKALSLLR